MRTAIMFFFFFSLLTYLRLKHLSYTEIGNFPDNFKIGNLDDNFMFLIEWHHFYTETRKFPDNFMTWMRYAIFIWWMFCIFHVPYEKLLVPIDAACFPWPETTKIQNSPKINVHKNSSTATIYIIHSRCGTLVATIALRVAASLDK